MATHGNPNSPRSAVPPDIGERVRAERLHLGWSQLHLAERVGVNRRTITRLEQGRHRPTSHLVQALERVLDLPSLVPGWREAADPAMPSYGPRARAARKTAGLTLAEVARAAGVSAATLSRFEREIGDSPALAGRWDTADEGVRNDGLAQALGFRDSEEMNRFCRAAS